MSSWAKYLFFLEKPVAHVPMMRVPTAPAIRSKVDLQIEIVPADGTGAANWGKRRLRYVAVFGAAHGQNTV
jgi:hypothetical protein